MPNARDLAEFVLAIARDAVDRTVAFVASDPPSSDDLMEAERVLRSTVDRHEGNAYGRATWENFAAGDVLHAVLAVLHPSPREADVVEPDDGYRLLAASDFTQASAVAEVLLQQAADYAPDDWNYGNLVHHAHIIRGKLRLAEGDSSGGAVELVAAGDVAGSPQLDSFGPDLSLAWQLLNLDQDAAVVEYLRRIARFWTPPDPSRQQPEQ